MKTLKLKPFQTSKIKFLSLAVGLFIFCKSYATNYYISNTGNDNSSGTSPATAWKTIGKINSKSFVPGDSILFKKGDTWRMESLKLSSSGKSGKPIVYSSYGSGNRPEILGSIKLDKWTKVSGNIWTSEVTVSKNPRKIDYGAQIFFKDKNDNVTWGRFEDYNTQYSNLTDEFDWTWNNNKIYIYSATDPNNKYNSVEAPQVQIMIDLNDQSYITINGLAIKYLVNAGISDKYTPKFLQGLRITNCEIAYIGIKNSGSAYGITVHQSDLYVAFNKFHDCGRRSISLTMYNNSPNITFENVVIEHNHFYNGFHTTGVDCNNAGAHTIRNIIIRENFFEGDPDEDLGGEDGHNSNHIFLANQGTGNIYGFKIYNNIFTYAHASSIKLEGVDNVEIYFNTFYGFNPTLANYQAHIYSYYNPQNITVKNNIFYSNAKDNKLTCIKLDKEFMDQFTINNNLYYATNSNARLMQNNNGTHYGFSQWTTYKSVTGFDQDSPTPADPQFINPPVNLGIKSSSPARGVAQAMEEMQVDFAGSQMKSPYDIGALQFGSETNLISIEFVDSSETGNLSNKIIVFPNPVRDELHITTNTVKADSFKVMIYNMKGQVMLQKSIQSSVDEVIIPINQFEAGIYFTRIIAGSDLYAAQKFLVE